jgi:hypothetical protein
VAIRLIAQLSEDRRQIFDPDGPGLLLAMQKGNLIGHIKVDRGVGFRDYSPSPLEMVRIGPPIVIVEEAEIGGVGFRRTEVACVAGPVPFRPGDEGKELDTPRVGGLNDGLILKLMLRGGAIVDNDDFDFYQSLSKHGVKRLTEELGAVAGCYDD